eukprot:CAMPEP_0172831478 /NCGR_PEP_ID=MMETSP1075-20121228/22997_1 /TAXON_ID=2916 /ORGANISM="Ceratium fusus, Strain PA161109" /LENGTH=455 /DNA_ID=CAMNT_0013673951 /DNA_START=20 /DNA_END=1384 /DNA_ORIENTATION=-
MGQKCGTMPESSSRQLFRRTLMAEEDTAQGWTDVLDLAEHLVEETAIVRSPWANACSCGCWEPDHDRWRTAVIRSHCERVCERSGCSRHEVLSKEENPYQWCEIRFFGTLSEVRLAKLAAKQICSQGYTSLCHDDFVVQHVHVQMERLRFLVSPKMARLLPIGPKLSGFSDWTWCRDPIIDLLEPIHSSLDVSLVFTIPDLSKCTGYVCNVCDLHEGTVKITFAGSATNVVAAKGAVQDLLRHGHNGLTHPGVVHRHVAMPDWAHTEAPRWGLGPWELRHIENNWGVAVLPPAASQQRSIYSVVGFEPAVCVATAYLGKISSKAHQHMRQCHRFGRDAVERWGLGDLAIDNTAHDGEGSAWLGEWTADPITTLQAGSVRAWRRREHGAPRRTCAVKAPAVRSGAAAPVHGPRQRLVVVPAWPRQQKKVLVACTREENALARQFRAEKRRRWQHQW